MGKPKYKKGDSNNGIILINRINSRRGLFKCHCGKEFICIYSSIFIGKSKSCGCGMNHNRLQPGVSNYNMVASRLIRVMGKRKINNELSKEDIIRLIKQPCRYCGDEGGNTSTNKSCVIKTIKYNGIDRISSNIGYTKTNTVACCKRCNWAKNSLSVSEFKSHISKIYNFMKIYEKE